MGSKQDMTVVYFIVNHVSLKRKYHTLTLLNFPLLRKPNTINGAFTTPPTSPQPIIYNFHSAEPAISTRFLAHVLKCLRLICLFVQGLQLSDFPHCV